ncbi:uncharacterized protein TrAtP1_001904 [Trichoderma atroviride]|uniref:uncharacterized protein n=1 Tax=Hypocrea atroviridis TaxID=63577 RepID=UPI003316BCFD|nr:hypothetical protein TrAtP1_001904 [Trichoderma atroviride]
MRQGTLLRRNPGLPDDYDSRALILAMAKELMVVNPTNGSGPPSGGGNMSYYRAEYWRIGPSRTGMVFCIYDSFHGVAFPGAETPRYDPAAYRQFELYMILSCI